VSRYTLAWALWLLAFVLIEWHAYVNGGYRATLTGHCVALMMANPLAFIAVPLVFVGIALHLVVDGLRGGPG
jgi:hypothetical protein